MDTTSKLFEQCVLRVDHGMTQGMVITDLASHSAEKIARNASRAMHFTLNCYLRIVQGFLQLILP